MARFQAPLQRLIWRIASKLTLQGLGFQPHAAVVLSPSTNRWTPSGLAFFQGVGQGAVGAVLQARLKAA
jgi:hypothetical protein